MRQDDDSSVIEYSNWGAGEPAVLEESSGVVLNADETSEELGSWYTGAVTERHATVCERGRELLSYHFKAEQGVRRYTTTLHFFDCLALVRFSDQI